MKAAWMPLLGFLCLAPPGGRAQDLDGLEDWIAVLDWEIGDYDGPLSFTRISGIAIGTTGWVFVAQPDYHEVWVIDEAGKRTKIIGRRGRGPGEFESPQAMYWKGDSLVVWDQRLSRLSLFSEDGGFLRSSMAPVLSSALGLLGEDGVVMTHGALSRDLISGRVTVQPLRRQGMRSGEIDTLAVLRVDHSMMAVKTGRGTGYGPQPFSDNPIWRTAPNGKRLVLINRAVDHLSPDPTFIVTIFDERGDSILSRRIPFDPVPLEQATIDAVAKEKASTIRSGMEARGISVPPGAYAFEVFRDAFYTPRFHPPVEELAIGKNGEMWLRRETRAGESKVVWLVLSAHGEPVANVSLPVELELVTPGRDFFLAARRDSLDVYHLGRYTLQR